MTDSSPNDFASLGELVKSGAAAGVWSLDPAKSKVAFAVKHFWGAITVRGTFSTFTGEGTVGTDGTVTARLVIEAASLTTKNKRRDKHLRSNDFFDVEHYPQAVVTMTAVTLAGPADLACRGTLEAAGHVEPIEFLAHVDGVSARATTMRAELAVDRSKFAMTWSPLGMASMTATATVTTRFVRS